MDTVEVAGLRMAYERSGSGAPVLLVPGFVGGAVGTWEGQITALSDEFTVVAWDPPGSGQHRRGPPLPPRPLTSSRQSPDGHRYGWLDHPDAWIASASAR